jgi:hypothetical protein
MNQRAFNLFTALVSFVMILLAVILMNSMTQTEDKAISTLGDLELQSEIQAVADLARADALQVFIYNLRYGMESWITNEGNWFPLESGRAWDQIVKDYIALNFGSVDCSSGASVPKGQQFAFFVTKQISGVLSVGSSFGTYNVSLKQDDAAMLNALNTTIGNSISCDQQQKFFELLGCQDESDCPIGTFYVNLDLSKGAFDPNCDPVANTNCEADDQMYESLPKIVVRRIGTNQTLETRILPRSKIKVYVPIRIFKAVASAKKISDAQIFLSPSNPNTLHEELAKIKLGLCDTGSCHPREGNIFLLAATNTWNRACPGSIGTWLGSYNLDHQLQAAINLPALGVSAMYNPAKTDEMQSLVQQIVQKEVCDDDHGVIQRFRDALDDELQGFEKIECALDFRGNAVESKKVLRGENPVSFAGMDEGTAYCVSAERLEFDLKYFESAPLYMVTSPTLTGGTRLPYTIKVTDNLGSTGTASLDRCKTNCTDSSSPGNCTVAECVPA